MEPDTVNGKWKWGDGTLVNASDIFYPTNNNWQLRTSEEDVAWTGVATNCLSANVHGENFRYKKDVCTNALGFICKVSGWPLPHFIKYPPLNLLHCLHNCHNR